MLDCLTANRERKLVLDRRETSDSFPTDELGVATVIEVSACRTHHLKSWKMLFF